MERKLYFPVASIGANGHNCPISVLWGFTCIAVLKNYADKENKIVLKLFREMAKHISILGIIVEVF